MELTAIWRFVSHAGLRPAVALLVDAAVPSGKRSTGTDSEAGLVATLPLLRFRAAAHLNALHLHNARPGPDEGRHGYRVVAGYSNAVGSHSVLVVDVLRTWEPQPDAATNLFELGALTQLGDLVVGLGVATGIGHQSPPVRVTVGLQYGFEP